MVQVTLDRQDQRRLDQDHADARTLRAAAAALRSETNQARYTNRLSTRTRCSRWLSCSTSSLARSASASCTRATRFVAARSISPGSYNTRSAPRCSSADQLTQLEHVAG